MARLPEITHVTKRVAGTPSAIFGVWGIGFVLVLMACIGQPQGALAAETNAPAPAKIKISGYGVLGNRELKRILRTLELGGRKPQRLGPNFVEDGALILTARLRRDGYLNPAIRIVMTLENGERLRTTAADLLETPLPREVRATTVRFRIRKGKLYYYHDLRIEGLTALEEQQARSYFVDTGTLVHLKRNRIYTPEKLRTSLSNLKDVLERKGYREAKVEAPTVMVDDATGEVRLAVVVQQGARFIVRSVRKEFYPAGYKSPSLVRTNYPDQLYSRPWVQDFSTGIKTNQYKRGYPDTQVEIKTLNRKEHDGIADMDLVAEIHLGSRVRVGQVKFSGEKRTRPSLMARRVKIKAGDLLDPIRAEEGRTRLAQLGSFEHVRLQYQVVDEHTRNVLYEVQEGKSLEVSLLFGYGSYEMLRAGVEVQQYNIWGRGHHLRVKAIQSFKASSGELAYTMPEFIGNDIDLFVNGVGLRREEISFTREEYGGGLGAHKYFKPIATDISLRYNYEILNAATVYREVAAEGLTNAAVGAFITEFKHDRRDNPLYPSRGYKVFGTLEAATDAIGGDANYERVELWTSYHLPLGQGRLLSFGLSHGLVVTPGSAVENLPVNRRFYPGGQNSIRGYQEGEASPRNEAEKLVGAETYTLAMVEFEQPITPKWSLVFFSDSLGMARRIADYPFDTGLFSVGGGIRWRTVIGPVRLEYGHNLNPRRHDPPGTIQFSLGFPF